MHSRTVSEVTFIFQAGVQAPDKSSGPGISSKIQVNIVQRTTKSRTTMPEVSISIIFYILLVIFGITGNVLVFFTVIINSIEKKTLPASDLILAHLTLINLMISILRNVLVVCFQIGFDLLFSTPWCKVFMFMWTLLRSMSVWGTFSMSVFHYINVKNYHFKVRRNTLWDSIKALSLLWAFTGLFFIPAFMYTERGSSNMTFSVQLIGTTTRPTLGCIWNFPSPATNLLYVTASLIIHELIPVILMVSTNISTLHTLNQHTKAIAAQKTLSRVASERKAALVITVLVVLFVICWGTNVIAVNCYNFTRGSSSTAFLLTVANFGAYIFMGFSPLVLLLGHSKLRNKLLSFF
uniref:G-protein coupled receptors family 1 profile domain-containing protein n=1 Tax=Leptobrachium leishanense TaxID=445787 RepID=A0A8C5WCN2_9ANUR